MENEKKLGATDFLMLLAVLIWGINISIIKIALREFSPHGFNGIRLLLTSLILISILWVNKEGFSIEKKDLWKVIGISIIGTSIYQSLFIQGINLNTASNTSLIMALSPIFIAILSSFFKYEKIHWAAWIGIFISFLGFYLIISKQSKDFIFSWESLRGEAMLLSANICWAFYTVFSKPLLEKISPLKLTAITMSMGTIFYLPFVVKDITQLSWSRISFEGWASLFYSALFSLVIGMVIWYASIKRVGNSKTGIYSNITPVIALLFALFFLSERINFFQMIGAIIIFTGVYLTRSGYRFFEK